MLMSVTRAFDPEFAHKRTIDALALLPTAAPARADPRLSIRVAGLDFAHPVGLAAGFDKDARAIHAMPRFGFAAMEAGTVTPLPQAGNPRPRLFRLAGDGAVINRMGFNNGGQQSARRRAERLYRARHRGLFGINIGANKQSPDRIGDYVTGIAAMAGVADWLTINISSPNTPGLRALQDGEALDTLLASCSAERARQADVLGRAVPLFLKVAPDLDDEQVAGVARSAIDQGMDAIIIGNTTVSRPALSSRDAGESGGLSGAPLRALALDRLRCFHGATAGAIPLIAAGGIGSAADVWERIAAGASLIQLYSALVYEGPWLARRIVRALPAMLDRSGVASLEALRGTQIPPPAR